MNVSGSAIKQLFIFSLVVLALPMIIYPEKLGTELQVFSANYLFFELLFYLVLTFILHRESNAFQVIVIICICLSYRLLVGSVFSFLLMIVYSISSNVSFSLGLFGYLPGMLLHVVAAPLILRPVLDGLFFDTFRTRSIRPIEEPAPEPSDTGFAWHAGSAGQKSSKPRTAAGSIKKPLEHSLTTDTKRASNEISGFERATRYIGEDGSVRLAAIIDNEGLLLSSFTRGETVAEELAPYALIIIAQNAKSLHRVRFEKPERIDFLLKDERVVLASERDYSMMVIAERGSDDLLNIRINQALELIKKYMSERYSAVLHPAMEKTYA